MSFDLLKKFWFAELGIAESDLTPGKTLVVKHGTLEGYKGVFYFLGKGCCVVSAPAGHIGFLREAYDGVPALEAFDPARITKVLGMRLDRTVGPAWIGMIAEKWFQPCHGAEVRVIEAAELIPLLEACEEEERAHSSLGGNSEELVGAFRDGKLAGAAGYEIRGNLIAHIGVLVHPSFRGKGISKAAVSAITEKALESGLGIQYQTLVSNQASVKAAMAVGFKPFAFTIAARLL